MLIEANPSAACGSPRLAMAARQCTVHNFGGVLCFFGSVGVGGGYPGQSTKSLRKTLVANFGTRSHWFAFCRHAPLSGHLGATLQMWPLRIESLLHPNGSKPQNPEGWG